MQRHWNDNVKSVAPKPWIIEGCAEPASHQMAQIDLAAVFKIVNNLADDPATAIGGDRSVKMNCAMGAVRTRKLTDNCAFKRFRTSCTKRRNNTRGLFLATPAEIFARPDYHRADRTDWRVEERYDRMQTTKVCQDRHTLTSCALSAMSSPRYRAAQCLQAGSIPSMANQGSLRMRLD